MNDRHSGTWSILPRRREILTYLREAIRSLLSTKQRSVLALIGIMIGIGSVISLVSIGKIVAGESIREFRTLGTDLAVINLQGVNRSSAVLADFARMPVNLQCVSRIAPFNHDYFELSESLADRLPDVREAVFIGVTGTFADAARLRLSTGRFISDFDGNKRFAVLGANMAPAFTDDRDGHVVINGKGFELIGSLQPTVDIDMAGLIPNDAVLVPIAIVRARSSPEALVRMNESFSQEECARQIEEYLKVRYPTSEPEIDTAEQLINQLRRQTDLMGLLLAVIGTISLIVGGVGIMNVMLVSVSERRNEIGIRRAIGAKRNDIRIQFLIESSLLSMAGGFIGVLISLVTTWLTCLYNNWEFFFSAESVLLGAGISIAIGVVFGYLPAHQAAKLDPIAALRN